MPITPKLPATRNARPPVGRYILMKDGQPYAAYAEPLPKSQIPAVMDAALYTEYKPLTQLDGSLMNGEDEFVGMTNLEVMTIRLARQAAQGDKEAINIMLDRVLGKPKQTQENLNVSTSLGEYLEQMGISTHTDVSVTLSPDQHNSVTSSITDIESWL